jgi:hypothetical protein
MVKYIFKISWVIGIIILFIGANVITSIGVKTQNLYNINEEDHLIAINYYIGLPEIEWNKSYGGEQFDALHSVIQASNGDFIAAGETSSYGNDNLGWLVKANLEDGNKTWDRVFGDGDDRFYSTKQTSDEGFILAGMNHRPYEADFWLVKTDEIGYEKWSNVYDEGEDDRAESVIQTSDGNFVMAGRTENIDQTQTDILVVKTDSSGNIIWDEIYSSTGYDGGLYVIEANDGNYVIAGYKGPGAWILKINSSDNGSVIWDTFFEGEDILENKAYSIRQTSDDGYIIGGFVRYDSSQSDGWILKLDTNGYEEWYKSFDGGDDEKIQAIEQTIDGGYLSCGFTKSYGAGVYDGWILKTNDTGYEEWNLSIGGNQDDWFYDSDLSIDGGFIVAGKRYSSASQSDGWLIKFKGENQPPSAPTVSGPTSGKPGQSLTFTFNSVDPEGHDVRFLIDWGDGESETTSFTGSGTDMTASHAWSEKGTYTLTVKAEDEFGALSFETSGKITIPRNKIINNPFLNWLQCHPNMFPLLQKLI